MERESDDYTICNGCSWYSHQRIGTGTRRLGHVETIQTIAQLRSARILRRVPET